MWKGIVCGGIIALIALFSAEAQIKRMYYTSGGELIFSSASISGNDKSGSMIPRFTGLINFHSHINYDPFSKIGFYSGLEIQNVGFIYQMPGNGSNAKFRTYNLGIPIGIKLGVLKKIFLSAAYTIELPFHYKETGFLDSEAHGNVTEWLSGRNSKLAHSWSASLQLPHGFGVKFKYYMNNFFNKDYLTNIQGVSFKPYENFTANIFYISLTYNVLKHKRADFHPFY